MSRAKLLFIWLLCALLLVPVMLAMFAQAAFGSPDRALNMEYALDTCGNALFGGTRGETISTRTGNALIRGQRWAKIAAPIIDLLFGKGHCLANATIKAQP
jgi:hypothetical protein